MKKQIIIQTLITICLLIGLTISEAARADLGAQNDSQAASQKQPKERSQEPNPEDAIEALPVMWEEPVDLEHRDLFYGIGGQKGMPDPSCRNTFIKRDPDGTAKKIEVEDDRDRRWTVKFGAEARPETVATRIVWAVGYHTDQDYFVKRARIEGYEEAEVSDVRFERDNDGFKKVDRWDWNSNPFVGTRELDGLKTLMALLNNFDLKKENNKIVRPGKMKVSDPVKHIYYVNDLGATLGSTGRWFNAVPLLGGELPLGSKGVVKEFAEHGFIDGVSKGEVQFHMQRKRANRALKGVRVENARWMGELLARLSDKQLADAFRAGGFDETETALYVRVLRDRIRQLQNLK